MTATGQREGDLSFDADAAPTVTLSLELDPTVTITWDEER